MRQRSPQILGMISGLILIVCGIGIQVLVPVKNSGAIGAGLLNLQFYTDHPGLALAALGVILQIVALVGASIWVGKTSN